MADVYVNSEELREIAQSMKLKASNIMESYQNDATSAILTGSESIQISGLDTTQVLNSFNKIFTNLSTRINTLADFLINMVASEYDRVSIAIKNEFDNEFANELAKLLGLTIGTGGIGGGILYPTPSNPGTGVAGIIDIDSSIGGNQNSNSTNNSSQQPQPSISNEKNNVSDNNSRMNDSSHQRTNEGTKDMPSLYDKKKTRETISSEENKNVKMADIIHYKKEKSSEGTTNSTTSTATTGGGGSSTSGKFESTTSTAKTGGGGNGREGKFGSPISKAKTGSGGNGLTGKF